MFYIRLSKAHSQLSRAHHALWEGYDYGDDDARVSRENGLGAFQKILLNSRPKIASPPKTTPFL
jgi:hypothetical protein